MGSDGGSSSEGIGSPVGRRVVLGILGLGAAGIVVGARAQNAINDALAPLQRADPTGVSSLLPGDYFRYYTVTNGYPKKTAEQYRLTVDGLVDHPLDLSLADLQAMKSTSLVKDFQCVTGWRVPGVHWKGVLLADVLDEAGVRSEAKALSFGSFDGVYTESLTLSEGRRRDVMVAYEMDGAPVTTAHGGPARLYVAPMYGYKSIKWLSQIHVTDQVVPGFWETQGNYDVEAWIGSSNGRNDQPVN